MLAGSVLTTLMGKRPSTLTRVTSNRISLLNSGMVVMVFIMMMANYQLVASESNERSNTLLRKYCRVYKATNGEVMLRNLNTTFSSLRSQLSADPQVFYAYQDVIDAEYVYSFAFCREYLSTSQCVACFDSAFNQTKACEIADGGNIIYDDCSIRYENFAQNLGNTNVILDNDAPPGSLCGNESASQPITMFNQMVEKLLSDIRVATPRTSTFYATSTTQVSTNNATVYAIAQCVKNVSQAICQSCLNTAYNNLRVCLPKKEGRAVDFFCFMRYSETPFFQSNLTTNITPFLGEGEASHIFSILAYYIVLLVNISILLPIERSMIGSSSKLGIIAGVSSGVGLFLLILVLWYRRKKKAKTLKEAESGLQMSKCYNYEDLQLATHNFGEEYRVGKGGFGEVFKAIIDEENVVAVKRLYVGFGSAKVEFKNKVNLISNVQHRNLVRQLGWCIEGHELLLVLEYMPQGSLDKFLWGEKKGTLNWEKMTDIIFGVARGLVHLHNEFHVKIIHRDIKSNNILLDNDFQPKIADFGLARLQPDDQTHVSTRLAGTLGYLAPEYVTRGHLSEKVDIYSFGILTLEVISGRRCTAEHFSGPDTTHLLEHAWQLYERNMHIELVDEGLGIEQHHKEIVKKTIEIALMCTQSPASLRPTMSEVVFMLSSEKSIEAGQLIKPTFIDSRRVVHIGAHGLQKK